MTDMTDMSKFVWRKLQWKETRLFGRHYELVDGTTVVAKISFPRWFRSGALAESSDGAWTFKRLGFWQRRVAVRVRGTEVNLAVFTSNFLTGGGTLVFPDGRRYRATTNFWRTSYEIKTESGLELVRLSAIWRFLRMRSTVEILPAAKDLPELPWLVPLAWYLIVMKHRDAAVAGAVAGAGGR